MTVHAAIRDLVAALDARRVGAADDDAERAALRAGRELLVTLAQLDDDDDRSTLDADDERAPHELRDDVGELYRRVGTLRVLMRQEAAKARAADDRLRERVEAVERELRTQRGAFDRLAGRASSLADRLRARARREGRA